MPGSKLQTSYLSPAEQAFLDYVFSRKLAMNPFIGWQIIMQPQEPPIASLTLLDLSQEQKDCLHDFRGLKRSSDPPLCPPPFARQGVKYQQLRLHLANMCQLALLNGKL